MHREVAKGLLSDAKRICDSLHIKFWLAHGTLLGAVRDKDFVPWDFDLDGCILASDWSSLLCSQFMRHKFSCTTRRSRPNRPAQLVLVKHGIHFHIGLKYYYPPEDIYFSLPNVSFRQNATLPAKLLRGDYFIDFLGIKFRVPNPPEEYLKWLYGKNWETPVDSAKDLSWQETWKKISLTKYLQWLDKHPVQGVAHHVHHHKHHVHHHVHHHKN